MISIFTPTFNRRHLLSRLYRSLCVQTCKDFEWIIVDDGSEDGTEDYISDIKKHNKVQIKYIKQSNLGKHIAHNRAVSISSGELFLCVDSDDMLANSNVVGSILSQWQQVEQNDRCSGMISYKGLLDKSVLGTDFPENVSECSALDLAHKYGANGERNVIYRTAYLRKIPYPEFRGEKFCPDSFISDYLSKYYVMILRRSMDVICEYQEDGLSKNFGRLMKKNPKGFCISNMQLIDMLPHVSSRIATATRYWAFRYMAKDKTINYQSNENKGLVKICAVPGLALSLYYRIRL